MLRWGKPGPGRLVLLHGWGANGQDLLPLGIHLMEGLGDVVALEAPEHHPHVHGGRQWYPLTQEAQGAGLAWCAQCPGHNQPSLGLLAARVPMAPNRFAGLFPGGCHGLGSCR